MKLLFSSIMFLSFVLTSSASATTVYDHITSEVNSGGFDHAANPVLIKGGGQMALVFLDTSNPMNVRTQALLYSAENGFVETTLNGLPVDDQPIASERYKGYQYILFHAGLWRTPTSNLNAWEQVPDVQGNVLIKKNKRLIVTDSQTTTWTTRKGKSWRQHEIVGLGEHGDSVIRSAIVWKNILYANVFRQQEGTGDVYATILKSSNGVTWAPAFPDVFENENTTQTYIGGVFVFNAKLYIMSRPEALHTDWWVSSDGVTLTQIDPDDVVGQDVSIVSALDGTLSLVTDAENRWTTTDMVEWHEDVNIDEIPVVNDRLIFDGFEYIATSSIQTGNVDVYRVATSPRD